MLKKNTSGQFLYFTLLSITSGSVIENASGNISGRKSLDGLSGMIVLSGNIIELGGGSYRANLYDFDTNGDCAGYLFTASNAVAVQYSMVTIGGMSGALFPASGQLVVPASGAFVTASLNSGQPVLVYSGQLSGQLVTAASGVNAIVPIASISGVIANSGLFATVLPANLSGVVGNSGLNVEANVVRWLTKAPRALVASGHVDAFPAINAGTVRSGTANTVQLLTTAGEGTSGILDGCVVTIVEGLAKGQSRVIRNWGSSGIALIDPPWDVVPEGSTEFYIVTPTTRTTSGTEYPALPKAALSGVVANSGLFVTATATVESGLSVIATLYSGALNSGQTVQLHSGQSVVGTLYSGSLSGTQHVNAFSGVFATASLNSGQPVLVYSGQLSGQQVTAASGVFATASLNSGQLVLVYSGQLSGQQLTARTVSDKSGYTVGENLDKSGYFVGGLLSGLLNSGQTVQMHSGANVVVPKETLSGVIANSGLFTTVLPINLSGVFGTASLSSGQEVLVYSGQLSGQQLTARTVSDKDGYTVTSGTTYLASGHPTTLYSGQTVGVYSGNLSGQGVTTLTNSDKLGYVLATSGVDPIVVETGLNLRQAAAIKAAALGGTLSGAGTVTINIAGAGVATNRIQATVDGSGNRTAITLNPPA